MRFGNILSEAVISPQAPGQGSLPGTPKTSFSADLSSSAIQSLVESGASGSSARECRVLLKPISE